MDEITRHRPSDAGPTVRPTGYVHVTGFVLGGATLATGLVAGFLFDWVVAIMPALAQTDDRTFVEIMLELITTIEASALFLLASNGALVATGGAVVLLHRGSPGPPPGGHSPRSRSI